MVIIIVKEEAVLLEANLLSICLKSASFDKEGESVLRSSVRVMWFNHVSNVLPCCKTSFIWKYIMAVSCTLKLRIIFVTSMSMRGNSLDRNEKNQWFVHLFRNDV